MNRKIIALRYSTVKQQCRLNVDRINDAYKDLQRYFSSVRGREFFTDFIRNKLLLAHAHINDVLNRPGDKQQQSQITQEDMLTLNFLAVLGDEPRIRARCDSFVRETEDKFRRHIRPLWKWYKQHQTASPWTIAAGMFSRILAMPQLFIEGNHRTASLLAGLVLMKHGLPPYILTVESAPDFFELSFTIKNNPWINSLSGRWIEWKQSRLSLEAFLQRNANCDFLTDMP